jgi:hypothetical protein
MNWKGNREELFIKRVKDGVLPLFQARGMSMISEHAIIRLVVALFLPSAMFGIERYR